MTRAATAKTSADAVIARARSGWTIRREVRWWVPDYAGPVSFVWQTPDGKRGDDLTPAERRQMARLGRAGELVKVGGDEDADPPFELYGVPT